MTLATPRATLLIEPVLVDTVKVACDGDATSPHPRVFLTLGKTGFADCPYCSKHFVLKADAHSENTH